MPVGPTERSNHARHQPPLTGVEPESPVGRFNNTEVKKCQPDSLLSENAPLPETKKTWPLIHHIHDLKARVKATISSGQARVKSILKVREVPDHQAQQMKVTRFLQRLLNSITSVFEHYFLPTPANQAFRRAINDINQALNNPNSLNLQELTRASSTLRSLQGRKNLSQPLHDLIPDILTLTDGLVQTYREGRIDTELLQRIEAEEQALSEELQEPEASAQANPASQMESQPEPEPEPEPVAVFTVTELEQVFPGEAHDACSMTDLAERFDINALARLQRTFPNRFRPCPTLLSDLVKGFRFVDSRYTFDQNDLQQLFQLAIDNASQDSLIHASCVIACLPTRFASVGDKAFAESANSILTLIRTSWCESTTDSEESFYSALAGQLSEQRHNVMLSGKAFSDIFPETYRLKLLEAHPYLLLHVVIESAIIEDMDFLKWLLSNKLSITECEKRAGQNVFSQIAPDQNEGMTTLLIDLGASLDARRFDNTAAFEDSETFPYDHQVILRVTDPALPLPASMRLHAKNPKSSTVYNWDIDTNSLEKKAGKGRELTGNYKLVIDAHGNSLCISDGRREFSGKDIARKVKDLVMENGGVAPKKIALASCVTGRQIPLLGSFAGNLTKQLSALGIDTRVTAATGSSLTLPSG